MSNDRNISVYCPKHCVAFEAPPGVPIHCNGKQDEHVLAEQFPSSDYWEYCCDCRRFYQLENAGADRRERNLDIEQCVSCRRHGIRRYLCYHCNVLSVESAEKGE